MPCRRWSERPEAARLSPEVVISRFNPESTPAPAYDCPKGESRTRQPDGEIGNRNPKNKKRKTGQMAINSLRNHLSIPRVRAIRVPAIPLTRRHCVFSDGTLRSARRPAGDLSVGRHSSCQLMAPPLPLKLFQDLVDGKARRLLARRIFRKSLQEIRNYRLRWDE